MKLLKSLYEIHSPSNHEGAMQNYIYNHLMNIPGVLIELDEVGNIYATKGIAETYPCCVAHMDEVHKKRTKGYRVIEGDDVILGYDVDTKEQMGIGADDKNGVWVCLKLIEKYDEMKVAFFVGEEIGCVGSGRANMDFFNDCRFVLQCDRRGNSDFISCASWTDLCSDEFIKDCNIGAFGYKETDGLMTDVQELKTRGLAVCACNISCGYYNPHTDSETTIISDLMRCYDLVCYIVENCTKVYPHKHSPYDYYGLSYQYDKNKKSYNDYYYDSLDEELYEYMCEEVQWYKTYWEFLDAMEYNYDAPTDLINLVWDEFHKEEESEEPTTKRAKAKKKSKNKKKKQIA